MQDKKSTMPWTEELDALVVSPKHHKILMENEFVRVLDIVIRPNEKTELHTQKVPASLYVVSWSDFVRYDDKDNIVLDSRKLDKSILPSSSSIWSEPLEPRRLENVGNTDIHVISVEVKN